MNIASRNCVRAVIVLLLLTSATAAAPSVEIKLRRDAQLTSSVVRIGDVAEIISADRQRAKELAALILMPAPAPGTDRFLMQRELQDLLATQSVNLSDLRFSGADRITISSSARSTANPANHRDVAHEAERRAAMQAAAAVPPTTDSLREESQVQQVDLERAISEYLNSVTEKSDAWRISIDLTERHWQQLANATSAPVCSGGHEPWVGAQRFVLTFNTKKGSAHLPIYAEIARPEPVVVALRAVERGMTITAADVVIQFQDAASAPSGRAEPLRSVEKVIGLEASRSIQAGEVLTTDHAKPPILVRRGEEVAVIAQGGGIRIRATARARQDGAHGDLIQVESLETRDRFDARVTGAGEVAVFTPANAKVAGRHVTGRRF